MSAGFVYDNRTGIITFNGTDYAEGWQNLTDAASITFPAEGRMAVLTLVNAFDGGRTLAAITGSRLSYGQSYYLIITQGGSGNHTLLWNASYKFAGGTAPTLSTAAGKTDVFRILYVGPSYYVSTVGLDMR